MGGYDSDDPGMWSFLSHEQGFRASHHLRPIRMMIEEVLDQLCPQSDELGSKMGRPSSPPE